MSDKDKDEKDVFAPPTPEEKAAAEASIFAPPTEEEKQKHLPSHQDISKLESARAGLAKGGTFGFAPRIGAAGGALAEKAAGLVGLGPQADNKSVGLPEQSLSDLYNEYLKYNKEREEKAHTANPSTFNAAELGGAIASPLNKLATVGMLGKVPEGASLLSKMVHGAAQGAKVGGVAGLSQSEDLSNLPQDVEHMGRGMMGGAAVGTVLPPVLSGISGAAKGTAQVGRSVFGPVGKMFKKGAEAAAEGSPDLTTEMGQGEGLKNVGQWASKTVDDWRNILKSQAKDKVAKIRAATEDIPKEQVDPIIQAAIESNPKLNTPEARAELARLKEMLLTAKEGELKQQTIRQYVPGMEPKPVSSKPQQEFPDDMTQSMLPQVEDDITQTMSKTSPAVDEATATKTNTLIEPPQDEMTLTSSEPGIFKLKPKAQPEAEGTVAAESPEGFAGYEAVHKATIEANDEKALAAFQHKVQEKLLDERLLGKNFNPGQIKIDAEPIPGSNKIRLVAKRAVTEENPEAFKEQAAEMAQRKKEADRLQQMLDKESEEGFKQKAQVEAEMLKPQHQDIQVEGRAGDRNIYNPEELYNLQQLMKGMSQFREGRGFSSDEVTSMAGKLSTDLSKTIKESVGTSSIDDKIHAMNNIGEALGVDMEGMSFPGGVGEKAQTDAINKLLKLVEPENLSDRTLINKEKMQYVYEQLQKIHPDLANQFLKNAAQQAETKGLLKEFSTPYEPSGINWLFNAIRKNASKASYATGYGIQSQAKKIGQELQPAVQAGAKVFHQYTPEALQNAAYKIASSGDQKAQQFGQVLSKLATTDERTRASMLFTMQQQTPYREMLNKWLPEQEETQSRNRNLSDTTGQ